MKYVRNSKLFTKRIKDRWYILEPNKRVMRELNEVASTIWSVLSKPCSLEDLVRRVCKEFKVEATVAEKDIRKFISNYVKMGLLLIAD